MNPSTTGKAPLGPAEVGPDGNHRDILKSARFVEGSLSRTKELDNRFAQAMGENSEWFLANQPELLRQHPEWYGMNLAVSSLTPSKILAVGEDRVATIEEAMRSPEILEVAQREGLHPGMLITAVVLGDAWLY